MGFTDPYTPTKKHYECTDCRARTTDEVGDECPDCGGTLQNLSVGRW
ncbi:hypothetical protein SAMN06269185_0696 [Natronoarchaeum philippinense]|uniref:DUF7129 domain-containing protein n=1 Tax=Natronoarchaeum philippinense TaxID=558529 RepID=A0A285NAZ2_NATPI|nr:rubrerythrin-like domain-containing protein [Natronoarchaeum philippinense]SNZ04841.1 hypothetical protein SAMN06269185_0696 [Natronoarchaeum philippinense]